MILFFFLWILVLVFVFFFGSLIFLVFKVFGKVGDCDGDGVSSDGFGMMGNDDSLGWFSGGDIDFVL